MSNNGPNICGRSAVAQEGEAIDRAQNREICRVGGSSGNKDIIGCCGISNPCRIGRRDSEPRQACKRNKLAKQRSARCLAKCTIHTQNLVEHLWRAQCLEGCDIKTQQQPTTAFRHTQAVLLQNLDPVSVEEIGILANRTTCVGSVLLTNRKMAGTIIGLTLDGAVACHAAGRATLQVCQ